MRTGLHANDTTDHAKIVSYYERSGAKVFKTLVFHDDLLARLSAMGVTIIGRVYEEKQRLGGSDARRFLDRVLDSARRHPAVALWEGHNEAWHIPGEIERYAEAEIERMKALEGLGKKAVIGNFACGTPELSSWPLFRPALEYAAAHGHALGLHEYSGPYMQYLVETVDGRNQWDHANKQWTGASADRALYYDRTLEGWLTLRYRKVYRLLATWGIGGLPLYITEGGIDNVTPRPGPQGSGWKTFDGEWSRIPTVGDYAQQRRWYMWQAGQDRFMRGVVDFGWEGSKSDWESFDMSNAPEMVERLIEAERDLPLGHADDPRPPAGRQVVQRLAKHSSSRAGERPAWVVVHSTDTPVNGTPEGTAAYLVENDRQVSVHELVLPTVTYTMVPDGLAAHHAGNATLRDGTTGSAVNRVSWGIELYQVHGESVSSGIAAAGLERIVLACRRLGIGADRVVGHREIDPGRRSDPVGVDLDALRRAVAGQLGGVPAPAELPWDKLVAAAQAEHGRAGVRMNAKSALQRTAMADGLVPTINEISPEGITLIRAESPAAGAWLYVWHSGKVIRRKL